MDKRGDRKFGGEGANNRDPRSGGSKREHGRIVNPRRDEGGNQGRHRKK